MKKNFLLLFCLCGLLFTACKDKDSKKEDVVLTGEISLSMDFKKIASGEFTVDVTADGAWTATSDKSWVKVSPEKGTGDATVTVTVEAGDMDEAIVLFKSGEYEALLNIFRPDGSGDDSYLMLSPTVLWKTGGGSTKVTVNSSSDWEAISNREWLVVSPTSGRQGTTEFMMSWENGPSGDATVLVINATKRKEISVHREYNAAADIPTGALKGKFTVGDGTQVYFSKGNLQYHCSQAKWQFANSQNEARGTDNRNVSSSYNGWIDLFGWGTSGYQSFRPTLTSTSINDYPDLRSIAGTNNDWGRYVSITNGGAKGSWRTLTGDEAAYLISNRPHAQELYGQATVNGVHGLVILPDDWDLTYTGFTPKPGTWTANKYSSSQWKNNFESKGAVFLPVTGYRKNTDVNYTTDIGVYWTTSATATQINDQVWRDGTTLYFSSTAATGSKPIDVCYGCAVRLVQNVR